MDENKASLSASILIVDDDSILRRSLADRLEYWGHRTQEASTGEEALECLSRRHFDLVLLDLKLPGMSGLDVLTALQKSGSDSDIVMLTAHGSVQSAVESLKRGAADFLPKPADFDLLERMVERSLSKRKLKLARNALAEQHDQDAPFVVGESPRMLELLSTAKRAAQSKATVMLRGESGVGKGVVAEYIHRHSNRSEGPFVYVNCVALSDDLIESTLFGHEKGAFTGAVARKLGRFEAANGGTAFLDEIGDISSRLQTKLLHFLESGEFERVGGTQTIRVDCRIVAATNRDLEKSVADGDFREDLLYRLNVITLEVPSLRQRREDIPVLAEAFIERFARETKRGPMSLTPETLMVLQNYPWPGNVRQLKNVIERMVVLAPDSTLHASLLPPEISRQDGGGNAGGASPEVILPMKEATRAFKAEHIRRALERTGGNQTQAAELLGMQRTFLNRLIRELDIRPCGETAD